MERFDLYQDIATRTNGDIYIGVVGPVRTGKSTFIKRVMDKLVLPNIADAARKQRVIDELPQSADGKTVMTTQPKFVPDGGIRVDMAEGVSLNIRLIDCVGYLIDKLEGESRMVKTPWSDKEMTFEDASELGTRKVMRDHSTIGVLVTTDGSITDFDRTNYIAAEERIASEMQELGKPYAIVMNTKKVNAEETKALCVALSEKYGVPVIAKNALEMELKDILEIFECILAEFPLRKICFGMPKWMQMLDYEHPIVKGIIDVVTEKTANALKMSDYKKLSDLFDNSEIIKKISGINVLYGNGCIDIELIPQDGMFYKILSEICNVAIMGEFDLFNYIKEASFAEKQFSKLKGALADVETNGYGIVMPTDEDISLQEPEFVGTGGKTHIKMRANATCLHIMKVGVETDVNPIIGTGAQSQEMANYLKTEYSDKKMGLWDTNMFGKSLGVMAREGLSAKMYSMPLEAQAKLRKTVTRIVNEGRGGVLCVLL